MSRWRKAMGMAVVSAAAVSGVAVPSGAAGPDPFDGVWASTDVDGSEQTLTVSGAAPATRSVTLFDESASVCGGAPAQLTGPGAVNGTSLDVTGPLTCRPGGNQLRVRISVTWTYDASTDTLTDQFGVVWHR